MQPASNSLIAGGGSPGFRAKNAADRGFRPRLLKSFGVQWHFFPASPARAEFVNKKWRFNCGYDQHGPEARVTMEC
jgi:hypothetical protein